MEIWGFMIFPFWFIKCEVFHSSNCKIEFLHPFLLPASSWQLKEPDGCPVHSV